VIREPGLHDGPAFRHSYVGRLLLLPNVSIAFTDESCSLMECLEADGAPAECCNNCSGALVRLSGFSDVSVFAPDGERVQCAPRRDCDPPSCPSWTTSGKKFEIVGSFHTVHQDFAFQLASVPRAVN
jgi:hypothetical protein